MAKSNNTLRKERKARKKLAAQSLNYHQSTNGGIDKRLALKSNSTLTIVTNKMHGASRKKVWHESQGSLPVRYKSFALR